MLPYQNHKVYGRSLLECSSFLASSAFPDPKQHGRGFLARLSGSTAEFLSIWVIMFIGPNPFVYNSETKALSMELRPALPKWLFAGCEGSSKANASECHSNVKQVGKSLSFKMFGETTVTYHNKEGGDLLGEAPKSYKIKFRLSDREEVVEGGSIPEHIAIQVRKLDVSTIDAYF